MTNRDPDENFLYNATLKDFAAFTNHIGAKKTCASCGCSDLAIPTIPNTNIIMYTLTQNISLINANDKNQFTQNSLLIETVCDKCGAVMFYHPLAFINFMKSQAGNSK